MKSILIFLFCAISLIAQEETDYYYYNKVTTVPSAPILYAWKTVLDFGTSDSSSTDTSLVLMISNTGNADLTVDEPTGLASPFSDTVTVAKVIAAGDSLEYRVFLDRNQNEAQYTDTWNFTSDGGNLAVACSAFVDTHYVPPFAPNQLDSILSWFTPASIWSTEFWGDTSETGYTQSFSNWQENTAGSFTIGTSATLKGSQFWHTNNSTSIWARSPLPANVSWANFTSWTVAFVDSQKSGVNYMQLSGITSTSDNNELIFMRCDNANKMNLFIRDASGNTGCNITSDSITTGKWGITIFRWNGLTKVGSIFVSGDSTTSSAAGTWLIGTTWNGFNELAIFGAIYNYTLNGGMNGGIAEIIAYRGAKDVTDINKIGDYLSAKYGLVWNKSFQ